VFQDYVFVLCVMPLSHRSGNRFRGQFGVSVVEIVEKKETRPIWIWTSRIGTKSVRSDIEMERDKSIRRAPKNGRPRRGQNIFGHVEKPHFGVSVFWLSKWKRVRNVLLEVMPNSSRG
jgi:hypothetical protein